MKILAFGNVLLDFIVEQADVALLEKYRIRTNETKVIPLDEMENLLEDLKHYTLTEVAGGCSQNTLRILKWANPNIQVAMTGAIGKDSVGLKLKNLLDKEGVATNYIEYGEKGTGVAICLISQHHRACLAYLGASKCLQLEDVEKNLEVMDYLNHSDIVYIEGYFLEENMKIAQFVTRFCNKNNILLATNLSAKYMVEDHFSKMRYLVQHADFVFGNREEYQAMALRFDYSNENILAQDLSKMVQNCRPKTLVITDAEHNVYHFHNGNIEEVPVITVNVSCIIDTTGAGDAFVGGYFASLMDNLSIERRCIYASYVASRTIMAIGCRIPPNNLHVQDFMKSKK